MVENKKKGTSVFPAIKSAPISDIEHVTKLQQSTLWDIIHRLERQQLVFITDDDNNYRKIISIDTT